MTSIRERLNQLDDQLMRLLDERFSLMGEVAKAKKAQNVPLTDPKREALILQKTEPYPHANEIREVYQSIFKEAKKLQKGRSL